MNDTKGWTIGHFDPSKPGGIDFHIKKEKGTVASDAPKEKETRSKAIVERAAAVVKIPEILEPELPRLKQPKNIADAAAQMLGEREALVNLAGQAAVRFYKLGMLASYVKSKIGHGNYTDWIKEHTLYDPRTIRRYVKYFDACNVAGKLLLGKTDRIKTDTLSLLPPADTDSEGVERPTHQPGNSKEWDASECATALLKRFENLTARRTTDERWHVLEGFQDLARDFINSRESDRAAIRGEEK
jgi:hypothetical protein